MGYNPKRIQNLFFLRNSNETLVDSNGSDISEGDNNNDSNNNNSHYMNDKMLILFQLRNNRHFN